jgi:hypothetical protein
MERIQKAIKWVRTWRTPIHEKSKVELHGLSGAGFFKSIPYTPLAARHFARNLQRQARQPNMQTSHIYWCPWRVATLLPKYEKGDFV